RVDAFDELAKTGGGPSGGPTGVVAKPEGRRPGMVLAADHAYLGAVDANNSGDHRQVDAVSLHPWPLLDVQLEEGRNRRQVLLGVEHAIHLASGRSDHLRDRDALPIAAFAKLLEIERPGECQAAD